MNDVTRILSAIEQGDPQTPDELLPLVYDELRKLAAQKLAREAPGQTLQATALVHEAYVRLVDTERIQSWESRGHFFAAAAEAMRRILIENARRKQTEKHGGSESRRSIDEVEIDPRHPPKTSSPSMRRSRSWRSKTRSRPSSSTCVTSPAYRSKTPRKSSASPAQRPIATGITPRSGCIASCTGRTDRRIIQESLPAREPLPKLFSH